MEFSFYRNFLTVARSESITAAAREISIAQSALTAQIKTLEACYGVTLIRTGRGRRQLELTEAGRAFAERARQICDAEEALMADMLNAHRQAAGLLRVAVSPVKSRFFINTYLLPFSRQYPNISYHFHAESVRRQVKHMERGIIDFAYANAPLPHKEVFSLWPAPKESFYAVCRKDVMASLPTPLTPDAFHQRRICCNYGSFHLLRTAFARYHVSPELSLISNAGESMFDFVSGSDAVALINLSEEETLPLSLVRRKVEARDLWCTPALYWSRTRALPAAARQFLSFCRTLHPQKETT